MHDCWCKSRLNFLNFFLTLLTNPKKHYFLLILVLKVTPPQLKKPKKPRMTQMLVYNLGNVSKRSETFFFGKFGAFRTIWHLGVTWFNLKQKELCRKRKSFASTSQKRKSTVGKFQGFFCGVFFFEVNIFRRKHPPPPPKKKKKWKFLLSGWFCSNYLFLPKFP